LPGYYDDVHDRYITMAVCFGVIAQYDRVIAFQKEAPALRDALAASAATAKNAKDPAPIEEASELLEVLLWLQKGGAIAVPAATVGAPPYGVTELPVVMRRIEVRLRPKGNADKGLAHWTSSAKVFAANTKEVIHEAELLAMLAKVIQEPKSFRYGGDPTFDQYAQDLQSAALDVVAAAKSNSVTAAQSAMRNIDKACANCHGALR
jgi:hypothetical protein